MKKKVLWLLAAATVATGLCFGNPASAKAEDETKIADGIYIGTVYVGGMTEEEANAAISEYVEKLMSTTFTLKGVDGTSVDATAEEMGITADASDSVATALGVTHTGNLISRYKDSVDLKNKERVLPISLEVDKQATAMFIYNHHDSLSKEAVNATLKKSGSEFTYVPGTDGEQVKEVESVYAINDFLGKEYDGEKTEIQLVTEVVEARGTKEELSVVKDLLGTYTTTYGNNSGSSREHNVENGARFVDGTVVYPGEEYFTHKNLEPITEENGYEMGGTYLNGAIVDSVGGGICQVSTTLYNAAIRAELEITQRFNHSMTVTYVDPSADAAMAGDYKDLRFINNTDYPIYLELNTDGVYITANIYGCETREEGRKVDYESVIVSQGEETFQAKVDETQDLGYYNIDQYAHLQISAQLWKVVTVNGKEESRELFNTSNYKESPKIVTIGTKGATAEQLALINNAVATNDEAQILAAIDQAVALSAAEEEAEKPTDQATDKKKDKKAENSTESKKKKTGETDTTDATDATNETTTTTANE